MLVDVTQEDIDRGIKGDCGKCPIALAIEKFGYTRVTVFSCVAYFEDSSNSLCGSCYLPQEASVFIDAFDYQNPVEPFSFTVTIDWKKKVL